MDELVDDDAREDGTSSSSDDEEGGEEEDTAAAVDGIAGKPRTNQTSRGGKPALSQ